MPAENAWGGTSVQQTLGADPSHTAVAAGLTGNGTKLAAKDSIVIMAPDLQNPQGICLSVVNNSDISYFVPWNTPKEWSAFQAAVSPAPPSTSNLPGVKIGACCLPNTSETICGVSIGNLGTRWEGLPIVYDSKTGVYKNVDVPYYGALNDVYGPLYASTILNNQSIDYEATYVCDKGTWKLTHSAGSCTPINGECASFPSGLKALPPDLNTLCGPGSLEQNLTGTGPWSWQCAGTPGMSTASCSANVYAPPVDGQCGPANGGNYTSAPPASTLCSVGGIDAFTYYGGVTWGWGCLGQSGGNEAWCGTNDANFPVCGSANGGSYTQPPPASQLCSGASTVSNFQAQYDASGILQSWSWTCNAVGYPPNNACSASNANYPSSGACGSDNGVGSLTPPAVDSLCSNGTPSSVSSNAYTWLWSCSGVNGGDAASCSAPIGQPSSDGVCGAANGIATTVSPAAGSLCSTGTPSSVTSNANTWLWSCSGVNGGDATSCSAPTSQTSSNDGICGPTDGTAIPNAPNVGLCASGSASTVTGVGPWNWTCGGSGGTIASCKAYLCGACTGTFTTNNSASRQMSDGACSMTGTASWTETDALVTSNANSPTLQWSDALGTFSESTGVNAAPSPQYCPPCYVQMQSVSNAGTTITGVSGNCNGSYNYNVGDFIPAQNVSVH